MLNVLYSRKGAKRYCSLLSHLRVIPAKAGVNTPSAKAGGFMLPLKAGSIGHSADYPLSLGEGWGEGIPP